MRDKNTDERQVDEVRKRGKEARKNGKAMRQGKMAKQRCEATTEARQRGETRN